MTATATPPQVAAHDPDERPLWREREPGEAPPGPAASIQRMNAARAFRVAIDAELNALCDDPHPATCDTCTRGESCERRLSTLLTSMLNAATEQVREETALMTRYRADPRHAPAIAAHLDSHEQLIDDLSAYVMDWGCRPMGEVQAEASALLKYWNEVHFALHDQPLMALVTGGAARQEPARDMQ